MTIEEIEHWRKFPLGNRALQVLDIIAKEKAMVIRDEDEYPNNSLFSLETAEFAGSLPLWQASRLDSIINALEQRDYIRTFTESSNAEYIKEISTLIKHSIPDAKISSYRKFHGNGFKIVSKNKGLDQDFSCYSEYLFITQSGLDYLARNREKLLLQVQDQVLDRWVVSKRISGLGEILPGIGPITRFVSETKGRIYVSLDCIPENLNPQHFASNDLEINAAIESSVINGSRYWFIRKENVLTSNGSVENCLDWIEKTLVAREKLERLKLREEQERARIEREYSSIKKDIIDGLDIRIKNDIGGTEDEFVLALDDMDTLEVSEQTLKM